MPEQATSATGSSGSTPEPSGAAGATGGPTERDWTYQVTDRLDSVVGTVRDKTTLPVTKIARAVVFGLLAGALGIAVLILFVIALVRVIDVYLPFGPYGRRVWVGYAGLGAIFVAAGAFCWSKRSPRKS